MCGIAGIYDLDKTLSREALDNVLKTMTDAISHRGPDAGGYWQDSHVPMALGHRRLSIIDLSADGAQPMASQNGRYEIVFNGEIYNFLALRKDLENEGAVFKGRSDTEVMLAAFEVWGINRALQRLNGMFAFALWDREKRQLHLVRDRLGKKPLYIGWAGKNFVFASELKAFRAHPDFKPVVNRNALALYMRFGCVPSPHTIYEGVWQMPPGTRITLVFDLLSVGDDLAKDCQPYWNPPRVVEEACHNPLRGSDIELTNQFEDLLKNCVQDRMVSDVPLGAFLSGGIDSSTIVALMQAQSSQRIKTFCIGFNEKGYDEAAAAQAVARHLGTDHSEIILGPQEAQAIIPQLPDMYDEPFADSSQIPTYLVSKFARENVTVALSGDGGDEMLGGYVRHQAIPKLWNRVGWWPQPIRQFTAERIHAIPMDKWDRLVSKRPQFGEKIYKVADILPLKNMEDIYVHVMSRWSDPTAIVKDSREPLIPLHDPAMLPRDLTFTERMLYGDAISYLPNDVLVKVDRASMAVALETRAPLLDYRVFEFCWRLPVDARIRHGQGKWLLRQVLSRHVPDHLFDRSKQGFAAPIGDWLRGPLQDWAHELLRPARLEQEGYLNPAPITAAWHEHLDGKGNHAHRLWTVLMFQSWLERWMK
jgi:asparagine synthase (glutamine-hydrolysing)